MTRRLELFALAAISALLVACGARSDLTSTGGTSGSMSNAQEGGSGGSAQGGSSGAPSGSGGGGLGGSAGTSSGAGVGGGAGGSMPGKGCLAPRGSEAVQLNAGTTTCAINTGGELKCWGPNAFGILGVGDTVFRGLSPDEMGQNLPYVNLGDRRRAIAVATGPGDHVCAVLEDGSLKCWGYNSNGQLGLGDIVDRGAHPGDMGDQLPPVELGSGRRATEVVVSAHQTCALLDDGSVKCWGANPNGELGLGDQEDRGDEPGEMGDRLPVVSLGAGRRALAIAAGWSHTCALLDDGSLKCWGYNQAGALGLGDDYDRGDEPGEMGDALPAVDLGTGRSVTQVAAGSLRTCALLDDASLKCWGRNDYGALGLGDREHRGDDPSEMGDNLPSVDLGTARATKIALRNDHSCARLEDGRLKCWGRNDLGMLGLGDQESRGNEPGEMGENLPAVNLGTRCGAAEVALGYIYTCAILQGGFVRCWGYAGRGALGLGDSEDRGDEPGEMGDNLPPVDVGF